MPPPPPPPYPTPPAQLQEPPVTSRTSGNQKVLLEENMRQSVEPLLLTTHDPRPTTQDSDLKTCENKIYQQTGARKAPPPPPLPLPFASFCRVVGECAISASDSRSVSISRLVREGSDRRLISPISCQYRQPGQYTGARRGVL